MAIPGESFAAELFAAAGDVATLETEPEVSCQGAGSALRETEGVLCGGGGVCVLVEGEDMFAGKEVEGKGLDVRLSS